MVVSLRGYHSWNLVAWCCLTSSPTLLNYSIPKHTLNSMEDNKILKLAYTFFLGLLLAIFVGMGISTFYTGPKAPTYPTELNTYGKELTTEQIAKQKDFDKQNDQYMTKMKPYSRNVSIISLVASIVLLAASLLYEKRMKLIADGVLLGGVFTLMYSLGQSFAAENSKFSFGVVSTGLIIVLYLGYHRFVREHKTKALK